MTTKRNAPTHGAPARIGVPFTFSSGFEVWIRPMPADMDIDLHKLVKKPDPPMDEVTLLSEAKRLEPNYDHPAYQKMLEDWENELNIERQYYMLFFCVAFDFTNEMKEQVDAIREEIRGFGIELHRSDKVVYITKILATLQDYTELMKEIARNGLPTQEEVAEVVNSFPNISQRQTPFEVQATATA